MLIIVIVSNPVCPTKKRMNGTFNRFIINHIAMNKTIPKRNTTKVPKIDKIH